MPPSAKFTREEIVQAALGLVREEGIDALTARALGSRLGSSARPIFTVFQNMEEVQQAVMDAARARYKTYIQKGLTQEKAFQGVGTEYIRFSIEEPKLFQLLFMREREQVPDFAGVLVMIDENYVQILDSIRHDYGMVGAAAERLYRHLWIYTHGIAALCATNMCRFTGGEIENMMVEICRSLLKSMREEEQA